MSRSTTPAILAGADLKSDSTIGRRAVLTGAAAAALLPVPGLAAPTPAPLSVLWTDRDDPSDPIFAAIVAHQSAEDAFNSSSADDDSPEADQLMAACEAAEQVFVRTVPTTLRGLMAKLAVERHEAPRGQFAAPERRAELMLSIEDSLRAMAGFPMPPTLARVGIEPAPVDPVFAAIEAHRRAFIKQMASLRVQAHLNDHTPEHDAASAIHRADNEASEDAAVVLIATTPTTLAGVFALLDYVGGFNKGALALADDPKNWRSDASLWRDDIIDESEDDEDSRAFAWHLLRNIRAALERLTPVISSV